MTNPDFGWTPSDANGRRAMFVASTCLGARGHRLRLLARDWPKVLEEIAYLLGDASNEQLRVPVSQ
jgi:hypothetical protein